MKLSTSINAIIFCVLLAVLCVAVAPAAAQENNKDRAAFFKALERRDVQSIELFLSQGINVNSVNDKGDTPLTLASRRGYLEILLLELNPNYKYAEKIRNKIASLRRELTDVPASVAREENNKAETPGIEIRFKSGKQMMLLSKGRESSIDLNDSVKAAGDLQGKVIFSSYKNDNLYLLLDIFGPSKIPGGPGYCGAGEEYTVVWLKLDSGFKLQDIKSALYDSCLESITPDPEPGTANEPRYKIRNNAVKIDYKSLSTYHSLYYDNNKPGAGLTITTSPY